MKCTWRDKGTVGSSKEVQNVPTPMLTGGRGFRVRRKTTVVS